MQLKLAAEIAAPAFDVTWIWYDNEEVAESKNGLGIVARERPDLMRGDFAILGEPSDGGVEGGCNGTIRFDVVTHGVRSHSARSWIGHNAIHDAAGAPTVLAEYEAAHVDVDGLVYREGLNAVGIEGGVAGNVIPDSCRVTVNYRFAPDKTADEAIAHVTRLFDGYDVEVTDRAERTPRTHRAARGGVHQGDRPHTAAEDGLDRCRTLFSAGSSGGELRAGRPAAGAS